MNYRIKVLDEDNTVVDYVDFKDNLTDPTAPPYMNFNGHVGLTRLNTDKHMNRLVIMYFYPERQSDSYAEFISEEDAYNMCANRNRLDLASELEIHDDREVEVL